MRRFPDFELRRPVLFDLKLHGRQAGVVPSRCTVSFRQTRDAVELLNLRVRLFYSVVNFFTSFGYACPWVLVTIGIMLGPRQVRGKP